ncbi:hypothetical protein EHW00_RS11215, partial [Escherichia coli]
RRQPERSRDPRPSGLGGCQHISMVSPQALEARRKVIKETILSWLLVDPSSTAHE